MTKLSSKPAYCASCFQQESVRYVDFEAAYDGPVVPGTPVPIPVDDLVLCENCLGEAFALLDPQNLRETIEELKNLLMDAYNSIDAKDKAIQGSKATITELIDFPVAKFPGKPKLEALPEEVREEITRARFRRRGTSSDPTQKKRAEAA